MKIDEPKTPYVPHYDPDQEEDEDDIPDMGGIDAEDVAVDELDMVKEKKGRTRKVKEDDIPDLDLGEPEETYQGEISEPSRILRDRSMSDGSMSGRSEKRVVVGDDVAGELERTESMEEREKHIQFEEHRKKHYEMADVKNLLGYGSVPPSSFAKPNLTRFSSHPELIDDLAEDEDEDMAQQQPSVPKLPERFGRS